MNMNMDAMWLKRARAVTPLATQTRSKCISYFGEGVAPSFAVRGRGGRFVDLEGREYVDWSMALGAVALGYCHPEVDDAVIRQVRDGASFSLAHPLEVSVAEALTEIIPCGRDGMVRFVKTGSEATEAAMRIARIATGRDVIMSCGYHGWHSVHDSAKKAHPGVPDVFSLVTHEHVDRSSWAPFQFMTLHAGRVAAVLIEPVLHEEVEATSLQELRRLCDENGALLIFDEMVTGFRWALGGAQEYFGVMPDLACFGKAMANGYPLACVIGRRDLMEAGGSYISGTFGGEAVSLAAAEATIRIYRRDSVVQQMWKTGSALQTLVNGTVRAWSGALPIRIDGYPCKPRLVVTPPPRDTLPPYDDTEDHRRLILSLFTQEALAGDVLFHPTSLNVSSAHGTDELKQTQAAVSRACQTVLEALSDGDVKRFLRGAPIREVFQRT